MATPRTKDPSLWDRLTGYDGPQPLTDEATDELRSEGVKDADLAATGKPITTRMVREPSVMDRLTGYDGPQPLTPEGEKAFGKLHEVENAPVRITPIDLGTWPMDPTQVTSDWGMDLTDVKAPPPRPRPHVSVKHATADTSDMVQRMSDRLQAMVDPSAKPAATADAGQVRPGSMKGFFQNAVTGTGAPVEQPSEVQQLRDQLRTRQVPPELQELLDAQQQRTQNADLQGVSDALYSAFTRTPLRPAQSTDLVQDFAERRTLGKQLGAEQKAQDLDDPNSETSRNARALFASTAAGKTFQKEMGPLFDRLPASKIPGVEYLLKSAPKPMDPTERALKEAQTRAANARADRLGRPAVPKPVDPLVQRKRELEVQDLENRVGDREKGYYLDGFDLDPNARPRPTEVSGLRKAQATKNTIDQTIGEIENLYRQYGAKTLPDQVKGRLDTLVRDMQLALKGPEAYQLGVLTGPDLSLLEGVTGTFTGPKATLLDYIGGNNSMAKLSALRGQIGRRFENSARSMGYHHADASGAGGAAAPTNGPTPTGRTKTDHNGVVWEELSDGTARRKEG